MTWRNEPPAVAEASACHYLLVALLTLEMLTVAQTAATLLVDAPAAADQSSTCCLYLMPLQLAVLTLETRLPVCADVHHDLAALRTVASTAAVAAAAATAQGSNHEHQHQGLADLTEKVAWCQRCTRCHWVLHGYQSRYCLETS